MVYSGCFYRGKVLRECAKSLFNPCDNCICGIAYTVPENIGIFIQTTMGRTPVFDVRGYVHTDICISCGNSVHAATKRRCFRRDNGRLRKVVRTQKPTKKARNIAILDECTQAYRSSPLTYVAISATLHHFRIKIIVDGSGEQRQHYDGAEHTFYQRFPLTRKNGFPFSRYRVARSHTKPFGGKLRAV